MFRVALLVVGVVLLIPIALIFRSGGDGRVVETSGLPGAAAILETGAAATTIVLTAAPAAAPVETSALVTAPPSSLVAAVADVAAAAPAPTQPAPTAAATAAPTAAPTTRPSCNRTYEVAAGDYWLGIANSHGVSLGDLLDQNVATVDSPIFPGDEVCLPANASTPTTTRAPAPTTRATTTTRAPATTRPATTRPPATTTTTTAAPPANHYSRDEVVAIIRAVWPDELEEKAIAIATRESNLVPTVRNWCCYGLFQIYWNVHKRWLGDLGVTSAAGLYDPATNATAAFTLYQRSGGWGPWGG